MPNFADNVLFTNMTNSYFTGGTFKLMLLNDLYTPSEEHKFRSDVATYEITGTGYTAGGATVTFTIGNVDATTNTLYVSCAGVNFPNSTITARYGRVYKVIGTSATDQLCGLVDFGSNKTTTNTNFAVGPFRFELSNLGV